MIDDDLRAVMREHDHEAPNVADFLARHRPSVIRLRKKRWLATGAAAACVAAIAVVISVIGLPAKHRATSEPQAGNTSSVQTTPPNDAALTCPDRYRGDALKVQPWVPAQPSWPEAKARLAPVVAPTTAVVCAYQGANRRLSESHVLQAGLTELATVLAWAPQHLGDQGPVCGAVVEPSYDYLVGLTYPKGYEWVSMQAGDCGPLLSNGKFESLTSLVQPAKTAAATGQWPAAPLRSTKTCGWQTGSRWGQQSSLVPPGSTSITICRWGERGVTFTRGYGSLVDTLNALPVRPSIFGCQGSPHGVSYSLRLSYPVGPDANIAVTPFCRPAIDNGTLQARGAQTVLPIIRQLLSQH